MFHVSIRYNTLQSPEIIMNVRMISVYPHKENEDGVENGPWLIIYPQDLGPTIYKKLDRIETFCTLTQV